MSGLIPVDNASIPAESTPQPTFVPPQADYLAEAREKYAGLPQEDLRPPDYDALAAQNAAITQQPVGAEAAAPTGPLSFNPFQTSVLGDAPIAVDSRPFDKLLRENAQIGRDADKAAAQNASNLVAAGANEVRAIDAKTVAESDAAEAQTPLKAQLAVEAEKYQETVGRISDQARFETDNQMRRVRVAADAAQAFQFKDFWATRTTAGTIMGIISQALAGGLNGLANQPGAQTPLDKIIAQDFQLQQAKASQLQANLANEQGLLKEIRLTVKDRNDQAQAFYLASTQKIQAQIEAIAAKSASPTLKANAEAAKAAIATKVAEKMQDYDAQTFKNRTANLGQAANITNMRQTLVQRMAEVHLGAKANKDAAARTATEGAQAGGVDISNLYTLPAKQRQTVINRLEALDNVMRELDAYEQNYSLDPNVNNARIASIKNLIPAASGLSGAGLSEYVQKLEASRLPGKYEAIAGRAYPGNAKKLEILRDDLRNYAAGVIRSYKLQPLPGSYWGGGAVESRDSAKPLSAAELKALAAQSRAK